MADSRVVKVRAFGNEFLSGEWLLFTEMQLSICRDEEFRQAEKEKREKRPPLKCGASIAMGLVLFEESLPSKFALA